MRAMSVLIWDLFRIFCFFFLHKHEEQSFFRVLSESFNEDHDVTPFSSLEETVYTAAWSRNLGSVKALLRLIKEDHGLAFEKKYDTYNATVPRPIHTTITKLPIFWLLNSTFFMTLQLLLVCFTRCWHALKAVTSNYNKLPLFCLVNRTF